MFRCINNNSLRRQGLLIKIILILALVWIPFTEAQETKTPPFDLPAVLRATSAYCQKLEGVILDYYCTEDVDELIDPLLDVLKPFEMAQDWTRIAPGAGQPSRIRASYTYDYQCIRENRTIRERRNLLRENGIKKNESNAVLKTTALVYGNALLTPVGLFAERFQSAYDYAVKDLDKIDGKPAWLIEISPKPEAKDSPCLSGRAWIDPTTADILRIEWRDRKVKNWELFENRGKRFLRTPRLTMRSDFNTERNGIRFPNKLYIEEAYVDSRGRVFIRSKTNVLYKDFKFFSVDYEVR